MVRSNAKKKLAYKYFFLQLLFVDFNEWLFFICLILINNICQKFYIQILNVQKFERLFKFTSFENMEYLPRINIEDYRFVEIIGSGQFGTVNLIEEKKTDIKYAKEENQKKLSNI